MEGGKMRVLIAKPGLDGHDRGAKVIALLLRDSGMEVVYTGLHATVDRIVNSAIQEDVDVIGLSILSGSHIATTDKLVARLRQRGAEDITVVVGGVIPAPDVSRLKSIGVKAVFPGGASFEEILRFFRDEAPKYRPAGIRA